MNIHMGLQGVPSDGFIFFFLSGIRANQKSEGVEKVAPPCMFGGSLDIAVVSLKSNMVYWRVSGIAYQT
eukprot:m.258273 g.258273  ORF g.258273 m.258273 type:complete len:69 (-) comp29633_c0_seq1:97-303(-)